MTEQNMYRNPRLFTHLIFQDPPTGRQPCALDNMPLSVAPGDAQAHPGASGHLIEPPKDAPRSQVLKDHLGSNVVPRAEPPSVSFLERASNFTISN